MSHLEFDAQLLIDLTNEFEDESDRAAAILAAAYIDKLLGEVLKTTMIDTKEVKHLVDDFNAPLGTFAAHARAAYCLDLTSKEQFDDIQTIRRIRNDFAHKLTGLSFSNQSISAKCSNLKLAQIGSKPSTPRECFNKSAFRIMVTLTIQIQDAKPKSDMEENK